MRALLLAALRAYKRYLSSTQPASCRFVPSCADYAAEAVARHGTLFGLALAGWRVLRCNPFSRGGLDLVPQTTGLHKFHIHNQSQAAGCSHVEHVGRPCS